ncbi:MAG: dipeptidase [Candidatus Binatia bacterium]
MTARQTQLSSDDHRVSARAGADVAPALSRRRFLQTFGAVFAGLSIEPALLRSLLGDTTLLAEAAELSRDSVTIDLHCHPNALAGPHFPALDPEVPGNMKAGGVDCGLFAVRGDYPVIRRDPAGLRYEHRQPRPGELFRRTGEQLDKIVEAAKSGSLALGRSPEEITDAKKNGLPAAVLAIEGSDPLEGDISRVKLFYDRGVRVLQLMHYRINELGDIQTAPPRHNGLTPFGRDVVREMNRLGMIIDTAHCSPATLGGVLSESRHPVILSHTGPRALRKSSRHLEDKDMFAVAKKNGVIGIWPSIRRSESFEHFLNGIDYVKNRIGVDHVGISTDLFGLRSTTAVPTHKSFALIPAGLLKRGYSDSEVAKIAGGNCMRVFHQVKETRG